MNKLSDNFLKLKECFATTTADLEVIAKNFSQAMDNGLTGRKSSLQMLPSFIKSPTGREKGVFLAIDFGGTNVRALKVRLDGRRGFAVLAKTSFPLKDPSGLYDYTSSQAKAASLFDFIAGQLKQLATHGKDTKDIHSGNIFLGHTFSFPCRQKSLTEAILLKWTKEFETSEAEGRDVGRMLEEALLRRGLKNVRPAAVINDTAAALLSAAYQKPGADIASICGTGHNTCYLENNHPLSGAPMIVNMESGNFAEVPQTIYDKELDRASEKPSSQLLEKRCGGHYLGEILRLVAKDFLGGTSLPYSLKGEDLALLLSAGAQRGGFPGFLPAKLGLAKMDLEELELLREAARLIVKRSARLAAATFAGTLLRLDASLKRPHVIAVDGSLYEKMPGYAAFIREALDELLQEKAGQVSLEFVKDGSGIGAAIAAAIAAPIEHSHS